MVNIRKIKPEDRDSVRELIESIMGSEFKKESAAYEYRDLEEPLAHYGGERDIFLVAEKDGRLVGTVAIKEDSHESALLRRIFVHKDYRGKGYGDKLLAKALEFCFTQNYKNVIFRGTDRMQTALKLCLKNGFKEEDIADLGDFKLVLLTRKLDSAKSPTS